MGKRIAEHSLILVFIVNMGQCILVAMAFCSQCFAYVFTIASGLVAGRTQGVKRWVLTADSGRMRGFLGFLILFKALKT
ncbi:hypothetical protein CF168_11045 [Shewanella bicestrii]|uniref:Uncharacterized protein n=1 Tax=Shewanella bicestrii TaxID=2018305 RepID=A0A220UNX0_9GAMM|nr:hypothetical protein CF168_11045 [Shewanella bicestrii]